ncbi:hypothetical protein PV334_33650 [Streptomyces sp. ME02-7008A-1]|uniref:hypothetical protein n=1 Tax=Streptomyces sp. ME02-7008A TaxID=3028679 RepID=UPI0029B98544|nr:hypothetical protein [Streptomyces sp. ME02-7008A]MDX3186187.1 hypothetical protein [Streptomyces sp. ME02-7008A-1]
MTQSASDSLTFERFVPDLGFPGSTHKRTASQREVMRAITGSVGLISRLLPKFVDNIFARAVPCSGMGFGNVARRAGETKGTKDRRFVSTGCPMQCRRVDDKTSIPAAPIGGARFGTYTGRLATQAASFLLVSAAPVGPVGR